VVDDEEVEQLAALAAAGEAGDVGLRLRELGVRAPGEEAHDLRVRGQLEEDWRVVERRVAQRDGRPAQHERVALVGGRSGGVGAHAPRS